MNEHAGVAAYRTGADPLDFGQAVVDQEVQTG